MYMSLSVLQVFIRSVLAEVAVRDPLSRRDRDRGAQTGAAIDATGEAGHPVPSSGPSFPVLHWSCPEA